ncbi:hypothetical protein [Gelidibacter algens]|jgi:hypothetical protein|nr:hypothetical protein [Gelidibacter algens]
MVKILEIKEMWKMLLVENTNNGKNIVGGKHQQWHKTPTMA